MDGLVDTCDVGNLAPIATVMLPEALVIVHWQRRHLSGKRGAPVNVDLSFLLLIKKIFTMEIWFEIALLIVVYVIILFVIGVGKADNSIMDVAWGLGF